MIQVSQEIGYPHYVRVSTNTGAVLFVRHSDLAALIDALRQIEQDLASQESA